MTPFINTITLLAGKFAGELEIHFQIIMNNFETAMKSYYFWNLRKKVMFYRQ